MNFAARIFVGPQVVTGGERAIDVSFQPILFSCGLKRYGALDVVQARDARGRINNLGLVLCLRRGILVLGSCDLRQRKKQAGQQRRKRQEQNERELFGHEADPFAARSGDSIAILRNQLAARNHANQITMRVSDMAARDLHVRNPIMEV